MRQFFAIAAVLTALCAFPVPAAMAQDGPDMPESQLYDPSFTGAASKGAEIRQLQAQSLGEKGFIRPDVVNVSLVHYPYMQPGQFGILMAVPDVISGCFNLTPLEYEAKFVDPYFLDIRVKRYRRIAPVGGGTQSCDSQRNKMATALMVLDRKDLEDRGTKEIRFSTDAARDIYKITLEDDKLVLVPESMLVFKGQNMSGPLEDKLEHSFSSEKMIALQVPMAKASDDIAAAVEEFARIRALTPVPEESRPVMTGKNNGIFYFVDETGRFSSQIGEDGYVKLGTVTAERPFDGPEGRSTAPVELGIFATRPGIRL